MALLWPHKDFRANTSLLLKVKPDLKVTLEFGLCHLSNFYVFSGSPAAEHVNLLYSGL